MTISHHPSRGGRHGAGFAFWRLSANTVLQISSQTLPLLAGAVAIPFIYKNIDSRDFGVFTLALSMLSLFSLLDLGLGRSTVRFMSRALADGDELKAASVAAHSAFLLGAVSLALALLFFAMVPSLVVHWFQTDDREQALRQSLYLLAIALPICSLSAVFRSALEAREHFPVISGIQATFGSLTYMAPMLLSYSTNDIRVLIGVAVGCRGLALLAFVIAARRTWSSAFPWCSLQQRMEPEFLRFSLWLVLSNLLGAAILYGDRALLVKVFGLELIPFYNVPLEMLSRFMIVVTAAATVAFPVLSRLANNEDFFGNAYIALMTLASALLGIGLVAVSVFAAVGLDMWLGEEFRDKSTDIVRILLVGLAFQGMNTLSMMALNARGFARPVTLMHVTEVPLYFGLLYVGSRYFGLVGVAAVWSGRQFLEYVCFAGFQMFIGREGGMWRRQGIGAALGASTTIPLVLALDSTPTAMVACAVFTALVLCWAVPTLRNEYQQRQARHERPTSE